MVAFRVKLPVATGKDVPRSVALTLELAAGYRCDPHHVLELRSAGRNTPER
jgi:hypothetical protein